MKVMIVEDSEIVLGVLRNLLQQVQGATIVGEFHNAAGAINALATKQPDVMLLDVQLSSGNGMDVLKVVSSTAPEVRVLVVTNFTDDVFRKRYLEAGAADFFDKSRDLATLRTRLRHLSGVHAASAASH